MQHGMAMASSPLAAAAAAAACLALPGMACLAAAAALPGQHSSLSLGQHLRFLEVAACWQLALLGELYKFKTGVLGMGLSFMS